MFPPFEMKNIPLICLLLRVVLCMSQPIDTAAIVYSAKVLAYSHQLGSKSQDWQFALKAIEEQCVYRHQWLISEGFQHAGKNTFAFLKVERCNEFPQNVITTQTTFELGHKYDVDPPEPPYYFACNLYTKQIFLIYHKRAESNFSYFYLHYIESVLNFADRQTLHKIINRRHFLSTHKIQEIDLPYLYGRYVKKFSWDTYRKYRKERYRISH